ncbi:hypothetical protein KHA80_21560 [Anaerobacillus sp. HL2]|nr:hypothetical protein KHA80_21560 [Anaerobacillus sp. HL2]
MSQWLKVKDYRRVNLILGAILFFISLHIFDNIIHFYDFLGKYYFYGAISSGVILLLSLAVIMMNKKSKNKNNIESSF